QPLLLGRQAHVDLYRRGDGHRVRPGQPQAAGRTGGRPAAPGRPAGHLPPRRPPRRPAATPIVTDKGLAGADIEAFLAYLELLLIRPARSDEPQPRPFPNWLRQRIEALNL